MANSPALGCRKHLARTHAQQYLWPCKRKRKTYGENLWLQLSLKCFNLSVSSVRLAQTRKSTITPFSDPLQCTVYIRTPWHHQISSIWCRSSAKSPCLKATWESSGSTATRPHAGRLWKCSTPRQGKRFYLFSTMSRPALGPTLPPNSGYCWLLSPAIQLTTHLHLISRLRMGRPTHTSNPPLIHTLHGVHRNNVTFTFTTPVTHYVAFPYTKHHSLYFEISTPLSN
jgi:hypothetical protein